MGREGGKKGGHASAKKLSAAERREIARKGGTNSMEDKAGGSDSVAPKWVLVVDDDASLRAAWIDALSSAGYRAVGCEDAHKAFQLARALVPQLVILDLHMPVPGDLFLAHLVRVPDARLQRVPLLIISAWLDDQRFQGAGLSVVGRLEKPISVDTLLAKVREVVGPPH